MININKVKLIFIIITQKIKTVPKKILLEIIILTTISISSNLKLLVNKLVGILTNFNLE